MRTHTYMYLSIAAALLFAALGGLWYVLSDTSAREAHINEMELRAESVIRSDALARSAREVLQRTEAERAALNAYFIEPNTVVDFLEEIESLGRRLGATVDINTVSVSEAVAPNAEHERLRVLLAVSGTWQAVYRFIDALSVAPYGLSIETASLEALPANQRSAGTSWQAILTIHVAKLK